MSTETIAVINELDLPTMTEAQKANLPISQPQIMAGHVKGITWKDADGRRWGVGKDRNQQWVKYRIYPQKSVEDCEATDGHLLKPQRWPIPNQEVHYGGGQVLEKPGYMPVECERCGGTVILTMQMAASPPPDVEIILPGDKKK